MRFFLEKPTFFVVQRPRHDSHSKIHYRNTQMNLTIGVVGVFVGTPRNRRGSGGAVAHGEVREVGVMHEGDIDQATHH